MEGRGWRGQRRGFLLTHLSRPAQEAHRSASRQASGAKSSSVIVELALKFRSRSSRLFKPTVEVFPFLFFHILLRRRRAEKHSDVQSLSSCFDGVTRVICKPKQLFNELGDCKQMVANTKPPPPVCAPVCKKQVG